MSTRDYYNRRYKEVDKKRRATGLYEDSIKLHINRIEGLWREYVEYPSIRYIGPTDRRTLLGTIRW